MRFLNDALSRVGVRGHGLVNSAIADTEALVKKFERGITHLEADIAASRAVQKAEEEKQAILSAAKDRAHRVKARFSELVK